jgi:hypothetical protein
VLHRQIRRLLALENAIHIAAGAAKLIGKIISIGDQATAGDEVASEVDRGQLVPGRERDDQFAME